MHQHFTTMSVMIISAAHMAAIRTTLEHLELGTCEAIHPLRVALRHPKSYKWTGLQELVNTWHGLNWSSYHAKYRENLDEAQYLAEVAQAAKGGRVLSVGELYRALCSLLYNIEAEEVEAFRELTEREKAGVRDLERLVNGIAHDFARKHPTVANANTWSI